jgi:GNAT superfamily N-acetyltransferase
MIERLSIENIEDLAVIAENFYSSSEFLNDFNMEVFKKSWSMFLNDGDGVIFVSRKDGEITGTIGGCKYPDPNSGEMLATEFFWFVNPESRGDGLKLLKTFEKWAEEEGCKKVIMVHLSDSMPEKVKHIYERFGYKAAETHYIKEVA